MERSMLQEYRVQREQGQGSVQEQFTITVAGKDLDGARTADGIYMSVPALCRAIEIDHKPQIRRIKRHLKDARNLCQVTLPTSGGTQVTTCLALEQVGPWLKGVQKDLLDQEARERLGFYQQNLAAIVSSMMQAASPPDAHTVTSSPPSNNLIIVEEHYVVSAGEGEPIELRRDLMTNLQAIEESTLVHTPLFEEDTAIRESYLAGLPAWQETEEEKQPFYSASNQLEVYVSNPSQPVPLSVTLQRIGQLSMRTVMTGRIAFWLWNLRRHDPSSSFDGWVALRTEEILQLRGVSMHSRSVSPDSPLRLSDGYYEEKYKEQVYQDLRLLNDSYIRRYVTVVGDDQVERTYYNEWPYLRVNFMMEQLPEGDQVVGIAVKAGEWIPRELRAAFHRFAEIDKRIFQLNHKTDQLAIFLALYLAERWRHQAEQAMQSAEAEASDPWHAYRQPIRMRDLLAASMIPIDWTHLTARFAQRIEEALDKLYARQILGVPPACLSVIDKGRNWGKEWVDSFWRLLPALDQGEEVSQMPLLDMPTEVPLLDAPKRARGRKQRG